MRLYFILLMLLFSSVNLSSAAIFSPGDIEWAAAQTQTLHREESFTVGSYMVKAVQFSAPVPGLKDINGNIVPETQPDPLVFLEIYQNGILIEELIWVPGTDPYIYSDYEAKVSVTGLMPGSAKEWVYEYYDPWATVSIALRAKPKLEVTVSTDKTAFTSHEDNTITATVTVKNPGEAFLKNVDVNLDLGELELRGGSKDQLHQYYYKMEKGTSQSFSVILVVPKLIDQKSYTLSADAKGYEVKESEYTATYSTSVTVSPKQNYFSISKSVSKDRIYLTNSIIVRITAANGGMYDIRDIHINDSMNENFELKSSTLFEHDLPLLKPGQEWETTYSIKPLETKLDGFTIPAATAQFTVNNKQYSASSQTASVIVNGPRITLTKTVDKSTVNITEDVTVTVTVNNDGNIATKAEVKDSFPDGVNLVSGLTSLEATFLELNTPKGFSYVIRMNKEGDIVLPPAVANYTGLEYKGITRSSINSNTTNITVIDPSKIPPAPASTGVSTGTGDPTQNTEQHVTTEGSTDSSTDTNNPEPTPITPGSGIMFTIIALIFAAANRRR